MARKELFYLFLTLILFVDFGCKKKPVNTRPMLHYTARIGNIQKMQNLISEDYEINATDDNGDTPLHIASYYGHTEIVRLLLTNGADINAKNNEGWTALFLALPSGNRDLVKLLIANGADSNVICGTYKETPLQYAVREGHKELAEILINNGADVNTKTVSSGFWNSQVGYTPLHIAVMNDDRAMLNMLIAKGADVNAGGDTETGSPLYMTIKTKHTQNAKLLITHSANPNLTGGWNHDTLLHIAVDIDDANAIKMLIDAGSDVNAKAKNGDTPLIRALRKDNTDMAELILAKGADIGETIEEKTELFFLAVSNGLKNLAERLVTEGADVNASEKQGWTPLHCALWRVHWYHPYPPYFNIQNSTKFSITSAWRGSEPGHRETAELLLRHGANANIINGIGETSLYKAVLRMTRSQLKFF